MSLHQALEFEIAVCNKELEDAKKKVKTLQKRLRYLEELFNETSNDKEKNNG